MFSKGFSRCVGDSEDTKYMVDHTAHILTINARKLVSLVTIDAEAVTGPPPCFDWLFTPHFPLIIIFTKFDFIFVVVLLVHKTYRARLVFSLGIHLFPFEVMGSCFAH